MLNGELLLSRRSRGVARETVGGRKPIDKALQSLD
jgi:hypothetical protein